MAVEEAEITTMKGSDIFRETAENCLHLSEAAKDDIKAKRYLRMAEAWRTLADEQDWLDGEAPSDEKNPRHS